jgi:MFS family permease
VSVFGSALSSFALGVWIYETTRSVELFAGQMLAFALPQVLFSPLAGALADRWDRRIAMLAGDAGAGFSMLMIALLSAGQQLAAQHIILLTACMSAFNSLIWPAYSAATTMLVPKQHLGRASGMVQMAEAASQLAAPALAGVIYAPLGLANLVLLDVASYTIAIAVLLIVRIPHPELSELGSRARPSLLSDMRFGWTYITAQAGLLGLLIFFASSNLLMGFAEPLFGPMILDTWDEQVFGYLSSIIGLGMLAGTVVMSARGGTRRRVHSLLGGSAIGALFIMVLGLRPSLPLIAIGGFGVMFTLPIVNASSQAIWQSKVEPDIQGRVFSVRRMIAWSTGPLAMALAAPLAERVFKPLMSEGGALASSLGPLLGVGPARGIGLMIVLVGLLVLLLSVVAAAIPQIRRVELEIPDAVGGQPAVEPPPAVSAVAQVG